MVSKLLDDNTANIEKAKFLTAGLSAAQMSWRPQPGKWSIAQNLAHLNFGYPYLDTLASSIAAARAKGIIGNGPFRYGWLSSWIVKSMEPPPKRKFKAARIYTPSPDVDAAKALVIRFLNNISIGCGSRLRWRYRLPFQRFQFVFPLKDHGLFV